MQKKTIHRIIGVLVVAALVIIMLPLIQDKKEIITSSADISKAPPFPDQATQMTAAVPTSAIEQPIPDTISPTQQSVAEVKQEPPLTPVADTTVSQKTSVVTPVTQNIPTDPVTADAAPVSDDDIAPTDEDKVKEISLETKPSKAVMATKHVSQNHVNKVKKVVVKTVTKSVAVKKPVMVRHYSYYQAPIEKDGLVKLKNAAWVIQLGSFKNKTNALKLVNQLRANGYRAFIQQVSSLLGENTRVFVGPELKQASARALASQLEQDLHMRGIVISYKPLTL